MNGPLLHRHWPALTATLPYVSLGSGPTPVRELAGLVPGVRIWCKDESGYGSGGWGGNKVRKLEWILPDVLRRGAHSILTVGGIGTNWGLATALYAREQGLHTALALVDQPVDDHVREQVRRLRRSGAALHFTHTKGRTLAAAPLLFLRHARSARLPYFLPAGGSTPIGTLGCVEAAFELAAQVAAGDLPEPSHVVTAVGSGGTAAGLVLGLRLAGLARTRVVGVVVNDLLRLDPLAIVALARRTERLLTARGADLAPTGLSTSEVTVVRDWMGAGYGHPTPEALDALRLAEEEAVGLGLEPVYTAKALAALMAMAREGRFGGGPVLFLHTHGARDTG